VKQASDLQPIVAGAVDGQTDPVEPEVVRKRGGRGPAVAGALVAFLTVSVGLTLVGSDDDGSEVRSSTRVTAPPRDWDA